MEIVVMEFFVSLISYDTKLIYLWYLEAEILNAMHHYPLKSWVYYPGSARWLVHADDGNCRIITIMLAFNLIRNMNSKGLAVVISW